MPVTVHSLKPKQFLLQLAEESRCRFKLPPVPVVFTDYSRGGITDFPLACRCALWTRQGHQAWRIHLAEQCALSSTATSFRRSESGNQWYLSRPEQLRMRRPGNPSPIRCRRRMRISMPTPCGPMQSLHPSRV